MGSCVWREGVRDGEFGSFIFYRLCSVGLILILVLFLG